MESKPVIVAKATSDYSQGKMECNPVTTAKSTSADSSSPSPVEIVDGNSSPQKIENTPVTTAEATNGDSLSSDEEAPSKTRRHFEVSDIVAEADANTPTTNYKRLFLCWLRGFVWVCECDG
ncbi:unnamed protein product [Ilex paraguariensis]|uniref:Uncharacterized protein n=1 Tax=Ilex paraguariensis TaxID=185542 RepID=A0ABC8S4P6_9AQUA